MELVYTPIYAALLACWLIILALKVVLLRRKYRVGIGTNKNSQLEQAIRVHGNATEYVPISLILLACVELLGASHWIVHIGGVGLLLGRMLHAQGLSKSIGISFGRFYGTLITWIIIVLLSAYIIADFIGKSL